jgi:hypothetical protein
MTASSMTEETPLIGQRMEDVLGPLPTPPLSPLPGHNSNGHSRSDSSMLELAMESIVDAKDAIVEAAHAVEESVVHGIEEAREVLQEDVSHPVQPREEGDHSRKLSALALAVLVFYKVSGGAFGVEPAVKAAGPFYTLLGFIIFPFIWCIPEALITAELGSAYPEPAGGTYYTSVRT